jgi:orotidine-5'-phosphate decarboxylase
MRDDSGVIQTFADRFLEVRKRVGPLVWGLDPSSEVLCDWGLGDSPDGLDRFVDIVVGVATDAVGLVKPQSAFYERHGWRGIRSLTRLCAEARSAGLMVILDAKRGDVGSTNDAYAEAYLGKDAPIEADALTVHPYLGLADMGSFFRRAHEAGSCVLVVTRSSNHGGRGVQTAETRSGMAVEVELLRQIGQLNAELAPGRIGPVGAVIGPQEWEPPLDLVSPHGLYLAPGIGAQGATIDDVVRVFAACPDRVMPSASRSLLSPGPDPEALRDAVASLGDEFCSRLMVTGI